MFITYLCFMSPIDLLRVLLCGPPYRNLSQSAATILKYIGQNQEGREQCRAHNGTYSILFHSHFLGQTSHKTTLNSIGAGRATLLCAQEKNQKYFMSNTNSYHTGVELFLLLNLKHILGQSTLFFCLDLCFLQQRLLFSTFQVVHSSQEFFISP